MLERKWVTEIDSEARLMTREQLEQRILGYVDEEETKDRDMLQWFVSKLTHDDAIGMLYKACRWAYWEGWAMATLQDRLGLHDLPDGPHRERQAALLEELMQGIRSKSEDKVKAALRGLGVDLP